MPEIYMKLFIVLMMGVAVLQGEPFAQSIRKIHAYFIIDDPLAAKKEIESALAIYPEKTALKDLYVTALARLGDTKKALEEYRLLPSQNDALLEEIAWSELEKAHRSSQYAIRLHAMIGAYFANDRKSVALLLQGMDDSNAILRSIAIQLASNYKDGALKKKIQRKLHQESNWLVRSELIKAIGKMQIQQEAKYLQELLENPRTTFEEKHLAIQSLVQLYEGVDKKQIQQLSQSPKVELRLLACALCEYWEKKEGKKEILSLLQDPKAKVRIAAIKALVYVWKDLSKKEADDCIQPLLEDVHPAVAITACWALSLFDSPSGLDHLEEALLSSSKDRRRFASAAIQSLGAKGVVLAKKYIDQTFDPYVKVHLAAALIGQREEVPKAADALYSFFMKKTELWDYGSCSHLPFSMFHASKAPYIPQVANYPDVLDSIAQLKLLSFLAAVQDPRAKEAMQAFLQKKAWGISSFAASLLLKEEGETANALIQDLLDSNEDALQLQAAMVLAFIGKEKRGKDVLKKAYFAQTHERKKQILDALGQVMKKQEAPFFLEALEEPFAILRVSAASALLRALQR